MNRLLTGILLLILTLGACDMLETHPYDVNIKGERGLTQKNIEKIESQTRGKKALRFAMISDTQRWYDATVDAVKALNQRNDLDFIVHGGDQSDFGMTKEFMWMRDIFAGFKVPYVCAIGNHDCQGTGKQTYEAIYGDPNFAFTAGNVRFLVLNTNALEYDYSEPVPDFDFIEKELKSITPAIEKTVVLMHAQPGDLIFNNNVDKVFQLYLRQFPNLQFCLYGHGHKYSEDDLFNDGIIYYQCPNIDKRTYLVFTINEDGTYNHEKVEF